MSHDVQVDQSPTAAKNDWLASVVVFLVALPLCMGIAIASGVPVAAGLITGIVGGLLVGSLSGSPLQVSGPAAGLTVIVAQFVSENGLPYLGLTVLLAGLLQLAAGMLRLGQWFRAVSPAVVQGMLAGIGVLIFASQFHLMVDDKTKGHGLENLLSIPEAVEKGLGTSGLDDPEGRQFRAVALKQVGTLHADQEGIAERLAEILAKHPTEAQLEAEGALLPPLAEQQKAVVVALEQILTEVETRFAADQREKVEAAAREALSASQAALEDLEGSQFGGIAESQQQAAHAMEDLLASLKSHDWAARLGLLTIAVILIWNWLAPGRIRLIPAPLIAVSMATFVAAVLSLPVIFVEVPHDLRAGLHAPWQLVWQDIPWQAVLTGALVIAAVASAETLLCATAVDQLHNGPRTQYDRELAAQGVGNTVCGLFGALPMTGVIVRSAANVQAGAQSRLSAILHGLWLLIFVVGLGFVLNMIPKASLAAMLVYTGYRLVDIKAVAKLLKYGWSEVFIYAATVITIVCTELLTGVITGIILSAIKLLYTFSQIKITKEEGRNGSLTLHLSGAATFVGLPRLAAALEEIQPGTPVQVRFEDLSYIDHACLDLLTNWEKQHRTTGGSLEIDWRSLTARFTQGAAPKGSAKGAGVTPRRDPGRHESERHDSERSPEPERRDAERHDLAVSRSARDEDFEAQGEPEDARA